MWRECSAHLNEARETYLEHLCFASGVGLMLVAAGLACILHALIPACCTRTASRTVASLTKLFSERDSLPDVLEETSGALTLVGLIAMNLPAAAILVMNAANPAVALTGAILSLTIPVAYLVTNPQLEPVA